MWVNIPRFLVELLNFESSGSLLALNNVRVLVKLDSRSLLRNKIQFARACVRSDNTKLLLEYPEVERVGGETCAYIISHEEYFVGYSFCGCK